MKKDIEVLTEFLDCELGDYPFFSYDYELSNVHDNGNNYYTVTVTGSNQGSKEVEMKIHNKNVYVKITEDRWELTETFDWTIKYFWMALLNWSVY